MMDLSPKPHADRTPAGEGKSFSGTAQCGKLHKWPVTWSFVKTGRFYNGRNIVESRQVVTPECCPKCSGKAHSLKPNNKARMAP